MSEKCDQSLLKLVAYAKCAHSFSPAGEENLRMLINKMKSCFCKNYPVREGTARRNNIFHGDGAVIFYIFRKCLLWILISSVRSALHSNRKVY